MMNNITVLGAGSWGTSLAYLLSKNGHNIKVWSFFKDEIEMLRKYKEHKEKLPGIIFPDNIEFTVDIEYSLHDSDIVLLVVPSSNMRETLKKVHRFIKNKIVVTCSKGVEVDTGYRMSQIIKEESNCRKIVVLSGPSHAEEVARSIPTSVVTACKDIKVAEKIQNIFINSSFRVYTSDDVVGVELGGAIKNVIALCAGISDGLGYGDNTKAALMTRGLAETIRLGQKLGGNPITFSGLSGIGDLIVTCTSMHSRNRRAGILIGEGKSLDEVLKEVKMVVEGVETTKAIFRLAQKEEVEMPIVSEAYKVLFQGKEPAKAVNELMQREKKCEAN